MLSYCWVLFPFLSTICAKETELHRINDFTLKFIENVYAYNENFGRSNFAVSALSIWKLFDLISDTSAGETFKQLSDTLNLPEDIVATKQMRNDLNNAINSNSQDVLLKYQSAVFVDSSLPIHEDFYKLVLERNTDIYSVMFNDTKKVVKDINYYVCLATEGKIENIVTDQALNDVLLLFIDAIFFKANWTYYFDKTHTSLADFYDANEQKIGKVNMMHQTAPHRIATDIEDRTEFFELPYGQGRYSMIIFLPNEPIKSFLKKLSTRNFTYWTNQLKNIKHPTAFELFLPRFKTEMSLDLLPPLKYTGIVDVFDKMKSDLPGLSDLPLFISKVVQKVDIEINEEGTIAAAVSSATFEARSAKRLVDVNKPFVYVIVEKSNNLILFSGVYEKPIVI